MANQCTEPRQPGDTRYVYGVSCTWHAPIADAGISKRPVDVTSTDDDRPQVIDIETPCCPLCGGDLLEKPTEEAWLLGVWFTNQVAPGTAALIQWGRGRCFPDNETLSGAYRQAMEGQS